MTDANVVLGYIPTGRLASGDLSVDARARRRRARAARGRRSGCSAVEVARGIHGLANASMMRALRAVSSEKGRDPREFALVAYGGSGPVHAAGLAAELGVRTVIVPPLAGLFSAAGLLFARTEFHDVRFCHVARRRVRRSRRCARSRPRCARASQAAMGGEGEWLRTADLRYAGQSWDIEVDFPGDAIDAAVGRGARRRASRPSTSASTACATRRARRSRSARSGSALLGPAARELRAARRRRSRARGRDAARRLRRGARRDRDAGRSRAPRSATSARAGAAADRRVRHDRRRPAGLVGAARPRAACSR